MMHFCFYFKQVTTTENSEVQGVSEKNHAVQSGSHNSRQKHYLLTRQASEGTELAELLAEHQERQIRSMQGLKVGMHRKWGSSSRINELHVQTNNNGLRHAEQIPLNNGAMMTVHPGMSSQVNQYAMHSGKVCYESTEHSMSKY